MRIAPVALAGALALVVAARYDWSVAYMACALLALPAMLTALIMGDNTKISFTLYATS